MCSVMWFIECVHNNVVNIPQQAILTKGGMTVKTGCWRGESLNSYSLTYAVQNRTVTKLS